ncbi:class II aldolase/adducin family protein [Kamptonema formosum]|uniref:class II aldolase/adducin family protein n=1 Tax=Kamptonema formosum TaxID=331992 RepID=UPI00034C6D3E|nr:class II aldolase/adducin family protein [Oscillatoria sp. PCC 10802]
MHSLKDILWEIGDVGRRMAQINAAEGAAGNISVFLRNLPEMDSRFRSRGSIDLPVTVPALSGGWLIVSGSGRRLRDLARNPDTTLCLLHIQQGGEAGEIYAASDLRPTSEFNSHLAIHNDHVARRSLSEHAVVHAQPLYLTYLSHLDAYSETFAFNRRLLRWQPETILEFPEGIGVLPFLVPGSQDLAEATVEPLRSHRAAIWRRHGIVTHADAGVRKAGDLVEYAETAAHYEYLNLRAGEPAAGMSDFELRLICDCFGINQPFF